MTTATSRESDKFMLRLPDGVRDQLKKSAGEIGRSLNSEIVNRLQRTLVMDAAGNDQLTVALPPGLKEGLAFSAIVYDQSLDEHVIDVLQRAADHIAEYRSAADQVSELEQQLADARREVQTLRALSAADFALMSSNLLMLSMISEFVMKEASSVSPPLAEIAAKAAESTQATLPMIRERTAKQNSDDWDWSEVETPNLPTLSREQTAKKKA